MGFRTLGAGDRAALTRLFRVVFTQEPWNDDWSDRTQLDAYIDDLTGQNNSLTLGYFEGGRLVGLSMGHVKHWHTGTEYLIDEFCVEPSSQGRGVGTEFLRLIGNYLKERGIHHIFLLTDRTVPAFDFYRKNGFRELKDSVSFVKTL